MKFAPNPKPGNFYFQCLLIIRRNQYPHTGMKIIGAVANR